MFSHIFIYRIKTLLRSKSMIFWTMIFPIALATFFNLAFGNLSNQGRFDPIDVAVVHSQDDNNFIEIIKELSEGDERLFNLQEVSQSEAENMLSQGQVAGYIVANETPILTVNNSGIRQSILKIFLDQYNQTSSTINRIVSQNPDSIGAIADDISNRVSFTKEEPITDASIDIVLIFFYGLIAMTSFYGGFFGLEEVANTQADLSTHAVRQNMSPVHKMKMFLYGSLASLLIQLMEMAIFLVYLILVLNIDFSSHQGYILLTILVGSITGFSLGSFVGATVKGSIEIKSGILIGITMLGSFLSGMMMVNIKYIVQTRAPILAWINPVNLLVDALYSLYYFGPNARYFENIIGLLVFSVIFSLGTYMVIRRQKYASL